jgi:hypothetical protein
MKPKFPHFQTLNHNSLPVSAEYTAFAREPERELICRIIERAAVDYLKDCEEAADFFLGEGRAVCDAYFELLDLDADSFIEGLRKLKFSNPGVIHGKIKLQ